MSAGEIAEVEEEQDDSSDEAPDDDAEQECTSTGAAGNGVGSQFAYSSLSYLPADAGARRPDRLGLTYETWAEGCEPLSPACAIEFVALPTTWAQESNMGME